MHKILTAFFFIFFMWSAACEATTITVKLDQDLPSGTRIRMNLYDDWKDHIRPYDCILDTNTKTCEWSFGTTRNSFILKAEKLEIIKERSGDVERVTTLNDRDIGARHLTDHQTCTATPNLANKQISYSCGAAR